MELESRAGRTIRQIFDSDGEPEFRRLERELLTELLAGDELVVAAGGGAVMNEDTRREMQAAGPVVWLNAPPSVLNERINADATTSERRPSLTGITGLTEIENVLSQREPVYRDAASVIVETDGLTPTTIVDRIVDDVGDLSGRVT